MYRILTPILAAFLISTSTHAQTSSDFNVDKVIAAARSPKPNLVLLSAHRGVWRTLPENTIPAIEAALRHNFETVEIDVRLSLDNTPWLLHDFVLDRITDDIGYASARKDEDLKSVTVRYRNGTESDVELNTLEDALVFLGNHLRLADNGQTLRGFVLVIDLKSPPGADPNKNTTSAYAALKQSWAVVEKVSKQYPHLQRAGRTGPSLGQAVIFKMKAKEFPAPDVLERDFGIATLKGTFFLEPVMHPDPGNAPHGNRVLKDYFDKDYVVGYEAVMEYVDQPVAIDWIKKLQGANRTVPAFPSWNDYPEGFALSSGICCALRDTKPGAENLDYSGSFEFSLQIGGNWLTADTAPFLSEYLTANGMRDLTQIQ